MSTTPQRRQADPRLVHPGTGNGVTTTRLNRRPLNRADIDEGWLQALLHTHPDLLAVDEIAADYGPLISIGREIPAGSGFIDNLYVNPDGQITIVEAKLWKNPEARRSVVGQILEYANLVSQWTYDELDARCLAKIQRTLYEHVQHERGDRAMLDEDEFVDAVTRNLRRGRFLLLVVGDGIKEEAVDLMGVLQTSPGLHFTLGLVELRIYDVPGTTDLLVVPSIVARTQEIARTVIDLRTDTDATRVAARYESRESPSAATRVAASQDAMTLDDLVEYIRATGGTECANDAREFFDALKQRGLKLELTHANLKVRLPDPNGSGTTFSLFGLSKQGDLWVQYLPTQTIAAGIAYPGSAAETFLHTLSRLLNRELKLQRGRPAPDYWSKGAPFCDARPHLDAILAAVDTYVLSFDAPPTNT